MTPAEDAEFERELIKAMTAPILPSPTPPLPGGKHVWGGTLSGGAHMPLVDMPRKTTNKVLVAFLDNDDEPVWAKRLVPLNVDMNFDSGGEARMTIEFSLNNVYGD